VLIYNDKQWRTFFSLIGRAQELEADPRFSTIGRRTENIGELYQLVGQTMATRTSAEWTALLEAADIPVMPMHTVESLMDDPHLNAVGFFTTIKHPSEGLLRSMAIPTRWSQSNPAISRHAPLLGEHSAEVLAEAGYSAAQIEALVAQGATLLPNHELIS